jgi:hypothetical protein
MADIFHIYINAPGLAPDNPVLEKRLNTALDWIRYGDQCWLVHTTSDAAKWYERLAPMVKARGGNLLVIKVDPTQRQGWMPKSVWKWIRDVRSKSS